MIVTPRELDVLALLVEGEESIWIAQKLNLSVWTVKGYISKMLQANNLTSRTQLVLMALGHGLFQIPEKYRNEK